MRVEITKKHTKMEGSAHDLLVGLSCYIDALKRNDIPEPLIKNAIAFGLDNDDVVIKEPKEEKSDTDTISMLLKALGLED